MDDWLWGALPWPSDAAEKPGDGTDRRVPVSRKDGELRLEGWFRGAGASRQAIATTPASARACGETLGSPIESHAAKFPTVDHHLGDIRDLDVARLP